MILIEAGALKVHTCVQLVKIQIKLFAAHSPAAKLHSQESTYIEESIQYTDSIFRFNQRLQPMHFLKQTTSLSGNLQSSKRFSSNGEVEIVILVFQHKFSDSGNKKACASFQNIPKRQSYNFELVHLLLLNQGGVPIYCHVMKTCCFERQKTCRDNGY